MQEVYGPSNDVLQSDGEYSPGHLCGWRGGVMPLPPACGKVAGVQPISTEGNRAQTFDMPIEHVPGLPASGDGTRLFGTIPHGPRLS
jgi:hypothetical protein